MNVKNLADPSRKIIMFAVQLVVLIICIWFIEFIYYANIYPDKYVKEKYETTICRILNKELTVRGRIVNRYRADFLVSYKAAGVEYRGAISGNGLDRSFTTDRLSQENLLNQFDINNSYPCWYNPDVPALVVLVLRHNWSSTFPLFVPSVLGLIVSYYLLQSIFVFLGFATIKTREKIRTKRRKNSSS